MARWNQIISGFRALLRRERDDQELDDELRSYVAESAADHMAQGVNEQDAVRSARLQMGSVAAVKESVRRVGWESVLEVFAQDLRYGLRMLKKTPAVTLVCVATLGLAIGVNAAIFSLVNWLLLRPLPVPQPEQLTFLAYPRDAQHFDEFFSWTEVQQLRSSGESVFSESSALMLGGVAGGAVRDGLSVDGHTEKIEPVYVSGSFFSMLGIKPYLGRLLLPNEGDVAGADPVMVLSYRYWETRFGGDRTVVGKQALLDGKPVTIVGITPPGFAGVTPLIEMQGYVALGMSAAVGQRGKDFFSKPDGRAALVLARLRPGVTREQAQTALTAVGQSLHKQFPRPHTGDALMVRFLRPPGLINGPNPLPSLAALFLTLASLVLLLAAVNVTALLLARAAVRRQEIAIRAALGATRTRLVRQMLTESVLLALLGCVVGIGIGVLCNLLLRSVPLQTEDAFNLDFQFDWHVFAYLSIIATLTGLLIGLVPALRATRSNLNQVLHRSEPGSTTPRQRMRATMVVFQVSGALALIVTAGLFFRSLVAAEHANLGFDPKHVLNISFDPHEIGYDDERAKEFYRAVQERVKSIAAVEDASFAAAVALGDTPLETEIDIPGRAFDPKQEAPRASFNIVSPDYFRTMGMTLLRGQSLANSDVAGSTDVAVITPTMAQRYWPGRDPIGRTFTNRSEAQRTLHIIGVVNDSRYSQIYDPFDPLYFVPVAQHFMNTLTLQTRTKGDPRQAAPDIMRAIAEVDTAMPTYGVRTMSEALHGFNGLLMFEIAAALAAVLGGVGLLLSVVGIYGMLSFSVTQRTREFGIRIALGAPPASVVLMMMRQGFAVIACGLAIGMVLAILVGQLVKDFLVDVPASDPVTFVSVTTALALVGLVAVLIPAIRAAKVQPAITLRAE